MRQHPLHSMTFSYGVIFNNSRPLARTILDILGPENELKMNQRKERTRDSNLVSYNPCENLVSFPARPLDFTPRVRRV